LNSNSDVGLYQNGKALWGTLGAAFVEGVVDGFPQAFLATTQGGLESTEVALRILIHLGWKAVTKRLSKIRGPDFAVLNVQIVAGITRFIARGDDMSKALQGVSAGDGAQLAWAVGWMLQLETPTHDEIVSWGQGLSFSADIFVIGGFGVVRNATPGSVEGVYVGLGIGGGVGASFSYEVKW
jgi:hypothetical protein